MATLDTSCFQGAVGIANCACPCREETAPTGWAESSSGLYMADLIPMDMLEGSDNCNEVDNPWNTMSASLREALVTVKKDLSVELMKKNQYVRKPFTGMIGERSSRDSLSISKDYAGMRFSSMSQKGSYFKVSRIGAVFSSTGTISVQIYDRFNQTVGSAVEIEAVAGTYSDAPANILLPLWADGAENAQYFFVYENDANNAPRAIKPYCPPCNRGISPPLFSLDSPCYGKGWTGPLGWANWAMVGGWSGDNVTDFDLAAEEVFANDYTNGLTLTGEFYCDPSTSVCLDGLDYSSPVGLSIAHAIRYMAAIIAAEKIIRNPAPLRNAQVAKEVLAVDVQQWWTDYQKNIEYSAYNANTSQSGCIYCKPVFAMNIQSKTP